MVGTSFKKWGVGCGIALQDTDTSAVARDQKAYEIGLRAPVTSAISVRASGFRSTKNTAANSATLATTTTDNADILGWQLGTTYAMSKRTTAYAIYGT